MPSIAVIGASADPTKFGNRCVRAYLQRGYTVYPINPREATIEGLPVFRGITDIPLSQLDIVSVYLPAERALPILEQIATKTVGELILNPGADDPHIVARARELGLNVVTGCSLVMLYERMGEA